MRPPFFTGSQDYGSGSEHLVPGDRSQSAEIWREYFQVEGCRLRGSDSADIPVKKFTIACEGFSRKIREITEQTEITPVRRLPACLVSRQGASLRHARWKPADRRYFRLFRNLSPISHPPVQF